MSKQGRQYPTKANIHIFGDIKELDRIFETQTSLKDLSTQKNSLIDPICMIKKQNGMACQEF